MSDLIDRQAAIDALAEFVPYVICDESTESYTNGLTDAYNLICQLPSAQPERKKGKWKPDRDRERDCYCSNCDFLGNQRWNYCPNCGAEMEPERKPNGLV